jgi:uncharacterized protein
MRSATIYRVLAVLLVLIAAVLAWSHFGHLDPLTIQPVLRAIIGALAGIGIGGVRQAGPSSRVRSLGPRTREQQV